MIDMFNGALTLNQQLLHNLRESPQVVQRGLLVVLLVGLLVGGVNGLNYILSGVNPDRQINELRQQLNDAITQRALLDNTPEQREVLQLFRENIDPALAIVKSVAELPRPLPRPVGVVLEGFGIFVTQPLGYLGSLMLWVVCTHISARWLGGQGNIQQMLGLGALSVAPHALDALEIVPVLGPTLGLIASIWGLVILTFSTSVAHRLDTGRAAMAVLLLPLLGMVLLVLGFCCLFLAAVAIGAGAGAGA